MTTQTITETLNKAEQVVRGFYSKRKSLISEGTEIRKTDKKRGQEIMNDGFSLPQHIFTDHGNNKIFTRYIQTRRGLNDFIRIEWAVNGETMTKEEIVKNL